MPKREELQSDKLLGAFPVGSSIACQAPANLTSGRPKSQNRATPTDHYEDVELRDITTLLVERLRVFSYLFRLSGLRRRRWGDGMQPELPGIALTNNNSRPVATDTNIRALNRLTPFSDRPHSLPDVPII